MSLAIHPIDVADVAEKIAECIEADATFQSADWNDIGEVTVWLRGRCFRMTVVDITSEGA